MTLANTLIPWVRRIVKSSSENDLTNSRILEAFNYFYRFHMPSELQLFDLKTTYSFTTTPLVDKYVVPYEEYNLFEQPVQSNGQLIKLIQDPGEFANWANVLRQPINLGTGDGSTSTYTLTVDSPPPPFLRAFKTPNNVWTPGITVTSLDTNNNLMVIRDGVDPVGPPPSNANVGLLTSNGTNNIGQVNYQTGELNFTFPANVQAGETIWGNFQFFQPGFPTGMLLYDNYFQFSPIPDKPYLISLSAYKTPAAFISTAESIPFEWMIEYFTRGCAQLILSDVGDVEQFNFYQPLFKQQEAYVLRRTSRQNSTQRIFTIFANQAENEFVFNGRRW